MKYATKKFIKFRPRGDTTLNITLYKRNYYIMHIAHMTNIRVNKV